MGSTTGSRDVISSPAAAGSHDYISSPGASSSNMVGPPQHTNRCRGGAGARTLHETLNEDEAPDKVLKFLSICIGQGASDKKGEVGAEAYAEDRDRDSFGECFVHIRKQHSSN